MGMWYRWFHRRDRCSDCRKEGFMGINGIGYENYVNANHGAEQAGNVGALQGISPSKQIDAAGKVKETEGSQECQTCKNRKYVDGSDEMVSFKSPSHIAPEEAGVRVRAHEQEHVSNAYTKAAQNNGKVLQASVAIHTAICPECGRSYIAGGTTTTQIAYKEENPYDRNLKGYQAEAAKGDNVDTYAK